MTGLNAKQLLFGVIRPTLIQIKLWSTSAEVLLLGTALTESGLRELQQEKGPALGIYQMEPATHDDIWTNFLQYRAPLASAIADLRGRWPLTALCLPGNLYYATAMCRVKYLRVPDALPGKNDLRGMAAFWKQWYNTPQGAGTIDDFITRASQITDPDLWS